MFFFLNFCRFFAVLSAAAKAASIKQMTFTLFVLNKIKALTQLTGEMIQYKGVEIIL